MTPKPATILVIEDEETIRFLLKHILTTAGYTVLTASDGSAGVQETFSMRPDVVLTDLHMPDMDGITYIERIRSQIQPNVLPIIVVSGMSNEKHILQAFEAGATDYLTKPFSGKELLMRIQVALRMRLDPELIRLDHDKDPVMGSSRRPKPGGNMDMGKYRMCEEIGEGGMATVYHARHVGFGVDVALKVLHPKLTRSRKQVLRFLKEIRIAVSLDHANIVKAFDVGLSGEDYYYAMELLPSVSLADQISLNGVLKAAQTVDVSLQLAQALRHIHRNGIVHRDVKPGNVLFGPDGRVKLIDFGIATRLDDVRLTNPGHLVGSAGYVPPEVIRNEIEPGVWNDIYALGATMFCMLAGQTPFEDRTDMESILRAQASEPPSPVQEFNHEIPPKLSDIVMNMVSRTAQKRYSTMDEVIDRLQALDLVKTLT